MEIEELLKKEIQRLSQRNDTLENEQKKYSVSEIRIEETIQKNTLAMCEIARVLSQQTTRQTERRRKEMDNETNKDIFFDEFMQKVKYTEERIPKIKNLALSTMQQMTKLDFTNSEYNLFLKYLHQEYLKAKIALESHG